MAYTLVEDGRGLSEVAEKISRSDVIGFDIETTGLSPNDSEIRLMQFRMADESRYVVDLFKTKGVGPIADAFAKKDTIVVGQNLKFEQKFLMKKHGIEIWPLFDTFRASALLHNGLTNVSNGLWDLYQRELNLRPTVEDMSEAGWGGELTEKHYEYALDDVDHLHDLRDVLKPKIAAAGLNLIALIEFGAILPESYIETNGFKLDRERWLAIAAANRIREAELREQLIHELPNPSDQMVLPGMDPPFNLGSSVQMLTSLRKLGLNIEDTRQMTLAMFAARYPVIEKILKYREASKQLSSFGPDYLRHIHEETGRVHAEFYPFLLAGRYGCSNPNLAQVPRKAEFRECFRPEEGYRIVVADYGNIEMRIVAEVSGDETLIDIFRAGKDAHRETASTVMEIDPKRITKAQRQMAKPVNFGFIYGMQARKFVSYAQANYGVALTEGQAKKFRKRFFSKYRRIERWHEKALREGKRRKMAWSIGGRLRYLQSEDAHNEFFNTPIQATGADGLKRAMRCVYERLKKNIGLENAKMVHHVHDEIILEVKDDPEIIARSKVELQEGMIEGMAPFLKRVPVDVEASDGPSWADKA